MSRPAIEVESVSKRYRIGHAGADLTLTSSVDSFLRRPFRRFLGDPEPKDPRGEAFWALRDVSLEVPEGQALGMIGANGAGKSTLLKLLARITMPTEGRITLRGSVGSLLEVGTGFHPELTGRENIYLNGSILGMRRKEIAARYDEIVDFSGVEQFIETPVKRYSSGMFVRLGFSVAAHLEPDILLVDEVLSVGDADFQRKCMRKMQSFAQKEGRTIVFVSHNPAPVRNLCDRVALIENGRVAADGPAEKIINDYLERVQPIQHGGVATIAEDVERRGTGEARLVRVALYDKHGDPTENVNFADEFTVSYVFQVHRPVESAHALLVISTLEGVRSLQGYSSQDTGSGLNLRPGEVEFRATVRGDLVPGEYRIDSVLNNDAGEMIDKVEGLLSFTISNPPRDGDADFFPWRPFSGTVRPDCDWTVDERNTSVGVGIPRRSARQLMGGYDAESKHRAG